MIDTMSSRHPSSHSEDSSRRVPREPGYYRSERVQRPEAAGDRRSGATPHAGGNQYREAAASQPAAPAYDQPRTQDHQPEPERPSRMHGFSTKVRWLIFLVILVLIAVIAFALTRDHNASKEPLSAPASSTSPTTVAPFTTADAGSCLTWDDTDSGIENFEQTDCASEHRFEVSSREDLSTYPASEFGPDAAMPDVTRQAQLRTELCLNPTIQYMGGDFDTRGKYSVASILPPASQWEAGDRTLLCGIQVTDEDGKVMTTVGRAQEQDQARIFAIGDCVQITGSDVTQRVECTEEHRLEITSVVDLQSVFPDTIPSVEEQDTYLQDRCTEDARNYLGGDDALYYSTLTPFWIPLENSSWESGSHSVNCALIAVVDDDMAPIVGSAKDTFTINGQPPAERPARDPVVNPDAYQE